MPSHEEVARFLRSKIYDNSALTAAGVKELFAQHREECCSVCPTGTSGCAWSSTYKASDGRVLTVSALSHAWHKPKDVRLCVARQNGVRAVTSGFLSACGTIANTIGGLASHSPHFPRTLVPSI